MHAEVFRKVAYLKGFSKFLKKFPRWSPFQRSDRPKTGLSHLPCEAASFDVFLTPTLKII